MNGTPTRYSDVCEKALKVKEDLNLTDAQTLLYNHICQGDFYLFGEEGQKFYDPDNKGFGWFGNRNWVKNNMKKLVDNGLVTNTIKKAPRDGRYRHYYWFCPEYDFNDLIDAGCFVSTWKLFMIRHYLNLPRGFDKKNGKYGKIEFFQTEKEWVPYSFKYNGQPYMKEDQFNTNKGEPFEMSYQTFSDMIHPLWDELQKIEDFEEIGESEMTNVNATTRRLFTIADH